MISRDLKQITTQETKRIALELLEQDSQFLPGFSVRLLSAVLDALALRYGCRTADHVLTADIVTRDFIKNSKRDLEYAKYLLPKQLQTKTLLGEIDLCNKIDFTYLGVDDQNSEASISSGNPDSLALKCYNNKIRIYDNNKRKVLSFYDSSLADSLVLRVTTDYFVEEMELVSTKNKSQEQHLVKNIVEHFLT